MNTAYLKSNHNNVYKKFFNKYDLIISTPIQFALIWETSLFSQWNWSLVTQKIPFRNYIWINFKNTSSKNIELIYKSNIDSEFKTSLIENFYPINKALLEKIWLNWEIGFLSEYNWSDPPSIITNILTSILLIDNGIQTEDLDRIDINDLNHESILDRLITLDKKLLKEYNFFWPNRNNSNFIWSCFLNSGSHILTLEDNWIVKYMNIWDDYNFSDIDLWVTIVNPNSIVKNNYKPKLINDQLNQLNSFIKENQIKSRKINIFNWLEDISLYYAIKTFKNLKNLYNQNWTEFFDDVLCYRNILKQIFKNYSSGVLDVLWIKEEILRIVWNKNINLYIDQIWACLDARLVLISDKLLNIEEQNIRILNERYDSNFTIDYCSFIDWFETEWTKIEQYKSKKIFSEFSSGNLLTQFNKDRLVHSTIDYNEAIKDKWNDLLLDLIEKKIYVNWEKLTSNELLSQSTTIELLSILIEKSGEDIPNKTLSSSSYSKNKNEMLWKIVTPLVRLIKNKLWKELPLICKWSLNDFYIKLNSSDVTISLLKKLD
ncbi:MAG: hypothetical protein ACD_4C00144G0007 [uncultured bacterium (gcode 4)]|uniref:Uncharacterized protein n=1 Tax=uncultured bacterium (gcode 4) TaxID=1234023 RepID=K2F6Q7_9BACT|nr:MAG: hypothetical protein ACD_4C00144G0007 [uncultured bacterium (gcode 4)]